jgi:hypothetical protein
LVVGKRSKRHPDGVISELVNISQQDNLVHVATHTQGGCSNAGWGCEVHEYLVRTCFLIFTYSLSALYLRLFFFLEVAASFPSFTPMLQSCDANSTGSLVSIQTLSIVLSCFIL